VMVAMLTNRAAKSARKNRINSLSIRGNTLTSLHFTSSSKLAFLRTITAGAWKCQRTNTSAPRVGTNLSKFSLSLMTR
jgi:hypothetical protein